MPRSLRGRIILLNFSPVGPKVGRFAGAFPRIDDAASNPVAAVLPDRAVAVPLSGGPVRAQGVHAPCRRQGARDERPVDPGWLPAIPEHRLPAGLRVMPRLRVGEDPGAGI